jgi:hypothetical protein
MAARINPELTERWREKIRLSQIINRLDQCAVGEIDMTPSQLKAADMLLKKLVPDLNRTEVSGPDGGPVQVQAVTRRIVDARTGD